jgi:hypothetical protein
VGDPPFHFPHLSPRTSTAESHSPLSFTLVTHYIMSQLILALGSVSANGSSIRMETKDAVTQHRQSLLPGSLNSLVFLVQASELSAVYDSMELSGWVPSRISALGGPQANVGTSTCCWGYRRSHFDRTTKGKDGNCQSTSQVRDGTCGRRRSD